MNKYFFILYFLSESIYASILNGQYVAEGYFYHKKKNIYIILDESTYIKTKVDLGAYNKKYERYLETDISITFKITSPCLYTCKGEVIKIIKSLAPYKHAKAFRPNLNIQPIKS